MPSAIPFFALTTCGLEFVSAGELGGLPGIEIAETGYRRIIGVCRAPAAILLAPRTVDDVFLHLATWIEIERQRTALAHLGALSRRLDPRAALDAIAHLRPLGGPPSFSVTASFVGRRNYSVPEIKAAVAEGLTRGFGWRYQPDDRLADLNVRIFIEHAVAHAGLRLAQAPLHERPYRVVHRPGALKPTIAAGMLRLAEVAPGMRVLDPCCGTGTIVIEAALGGAAALGGDADPDAVRAAQINAAAAGVASSLHVMDMRALPLDAASVDRVVCNLPWGRQVRVDDDLGRLYRGALGEMGRVLAPGGRVVVLTSRPDLARHPDLLCAWALEVSVFGQRATVLVFEKGTG